jgi:hypothetical protein
MLCFEANSVGEKEGEKEEQNACKVMEDGDEASAQMTRMRGVP